MTRKHFQSLAYALHLTRPSNAAVSSAAMMQWCAIRAQIMDACAAANGRFDRDIFIRATEAAGYVPALHGR